MKTTKTILLVVCVLASIDSFGQLRVSDEGKVRIESVETASDAKLSVVASPSTLEDVVNNVGITSLANFPIEINGYASSVALAGLAGNARSGSNYAVLGNLLGSSNGAAIYGVANGNIIIPNGRYAGVFNGNTFVNGTITATSFVSPSDCRLKCNISSFSERDNRSTLENVTSLKVLSYNYKEQDLTREDSVLTESLFGTANAKQMITERNNFIKQQAQKIHFGVSAQELQTIYPNLVEEGQDGYLAVNYVELVPILIRSIQELKEELDDMKGNITARKAPSKQPTNVEKEGSITENVLFQNAPNPFKESTEIRFSLADDARDAAICIFDMQGKLLKKMPVSTGMESVTVNGYELGEGLFLYSLIVNGQEIDTKRMILTK